MRWSPLVATLAVLLAACTGGSDAATTAGSPSPTSVDLARRALRCLHWWGSGSGSSAAPSWCGLLRKADMPAAVPEMLAGDGWVPGVDDPGQIDQRHPCRGAVSRKHSHFFTADGQFGSRDAAGEQVDDGQYELVGDDRFVINPGDSDAVTFRYTVTGDTLRITPEIPACRPDCFAGRVERRGRLRRLHLAAHRVMSPAP